MMWAQNTGVDKIFGAITPPGPAALNNPGTGLGILIVTGIRLFLIVAAISLLAYLLWGVYDWITSAGEEEKLKSARNKMTNAVIGMILTVVALAIFLVVSGDILGIVKRNANGDWIFVLPTVGSPATQTPQNCTMSGDSCSSTAACCAGLSCYAGICQ